MKTKLLALVLISLCALQSCKKDDWKHLPLSQKCDYQQASSKSVSLNGDVELPLFTKHYKSGTNQIDKISVAFRNISIYQYHLIPLNVSYKQNNIIFTAENGAVAAALHYNAAGQLATAEAAPYFEDYGYQQSFRFLYSAGKLKEIQTRLLNPEEGEPNPWVYYTKINYINNGNNVSKINFGAYGLTFDSVSYKYDYTKTAKNQYYPDENIGDYFTFWYFLKYLNVFPELQPKNVLLSSYMGDKEYPGDVSRTYKNHVFDAAGKLVSYDVIFNLVQTQQTDIPEHWNLNWHCCDFTLPSVKD